MQQMQFSTTEHYDCTACAQLKSKNAAAALGDTIYTAHKMSVNSGTCFFNAFPSSLCKLKA